MFPWFSIQDRASRIAYAFSLLISCDLHHGLPDRRIEAGTTEHILENITWA